MSDERSTRRRYLTLLGTAAAAGTAGCSGFLRSNPAASADGDSTGTTGPAPGTIADQGTATTSDGPVDVSPYTRVYRQTIDSVVLIRTFTTVGGGQGSGFVYGDAGHVVTNEHVVAGAESIEVHFSRGEWRDATVVGTDAYSDLAVVKVEDRPDYAEPLSLLDSEPAIGREVVALGSPFGLQQSVSAGIVSGVDRTIPAPNDFEIADAIQTDAAVNPGNSGGPLVTLDGEVAGVISAGGGDNVAFAISAQLAARVVPALIDDGEYRHSFMGVRTIDVTPTLAEANDLDRALGVYVAEVLSDGPSDGALQGSTDETTVNGVSVPTGGDVVVAMGGEPIHSGGALSSYLALHTRPGDTISVTVLRDGERQTVEVTLGRRPRP